MASGVRLRSRQTATSGRRSTIEMEAVSELECGNNGHQA
jgi:hypothetical protein